MHKLHPKHGKEQTQTPLTDSHSQEMGLCKMAKKSQAPSSLPLNFALPDPKRDTSPYLFHFLYFKFTALLLCLHPCRDCPIIFTASFSCTFRPHIWSTQWSNGGKSALDTSSPSNSCFCQCLPHKSHDRLALITAVSWRLRGEKP